MLTAIEIENFKGFGERQRIELAPITLFFGANSAGKSSFFHALFFLHQLFEFHRTTPQELSHFSDRIDLGGFLSAVHAHDPKRQMRFRLEFWVEDQDLDGISINSWNPKSQELGCSRYSLGASTVGVDLTICGGPDGYQGYVNCFKLDVDEEQLVELEVTGRENDKFWNVDARFDFENLATKIDLPERKEPCWSTFYGYGALPNRYDPPLSSGIRISDRIMEEDEQEFAKEVDMMLLSAVEIAREHLNNLLYIGPMREVPPAEYSAQLRPQTSRWARGLAGWDALHYASPEQIDRINYWLGPKRLNSYVTIEQQKLVPLSRLSTESSLHFADLTPRIRVRPYYVNSLAPSNILVRIQDVGCGVSQVVPVVAAFLIAYEQHVIVEQPELHLHPRLQTELGDLLIETCVRDKEDDDVRMKVALVETHSEHLILRILRRIRETKDKELPESIHSLHPDDVAVHHFESTPTGTRVTRLRIRDDGEFIDRWPYGFFDERAEELF